MDLKKSMNQAEQAAADAAQEAVSRAKELARSLGGSDEPVGQKPAPVQRKVSVVIYNPVVKSEGGQKLSQVMKWSDPDELTKKHIADLHQASFGYANFQVVERLEVDRFPAKVDGFAYTADEFLKCIRAGKGFHDPDAVDYKRILDEFKILDNVKSNAIDEVWLFAFPYAGFYESIMGGPGAFWCNAPPLDEAVAGRTGRRLVIMGYNYERSNGQMLENMGHRAESIIKHVYRHKQGDANLWERFTRYDKTHPGQAEVGIVHYAPNSLQDYDWGNKAKVKSRSHLWKRFPNLEGEPKIMDTADWGGGDILLHHMWWFQLFPHITGSSGGISYNWWKYVIDPNTVE
jgi:hypothetical protein